MPRAKTILQSEFPYHVTARCINREWYKIPLDIVWKIYSEDLTYISWVFDVRIINFVLMPNHFHMLLYTPDSNLDAVMAHFMRSTAQEINRRSGRINQVYGARYYKSVISGHHYLSHAYKYVYANPTKAKLIDCCEKYRFSSLAFLLGNSKATFPVINDPFLFENLDDTLSWINKIPNDDDWQTISKGMKKSKFKLLRNPQTNKPHHLEDDKL